MDHSGLFDFSFYRLKTKNLLFLLIELFLR